MAFLLQDLIFALRLLARQPVYSVTAVLTLALGIGANSAVFSLIDAILLRPLEYHEPERLVWLWESNPAQKLPVVPVSPADFADWRAQSRSFESMAAWRDVSMTLGGLDLPERLSGARVFPELLDVLGGKPALGRAFRSGEGAPGGERVAVVTHGLWQRRFGGDPALIGRPIVLDGASYTVVGILPQRFQFPFSRVEVLVPWIPGAGEAAERGAKFRVLRVVARLKPGVPFEQARAEMSSIARRLEQSYPASNRGWGVNVMPLREFFIAEFRPGFVALMAAVVLVVLIACVNVANLLLARAAGRRREIAVRAALGAGRARLARQLLTESVLLSLLGGAAGLLVAAAGARWLLALIPEFNLPIPGLDSVRVDWRVAAFTLGLSVLTGALFGLAPLAQVSSPDFHESLKEGGRGSSGGPRSRRLRNLLVAMEIGLAVVLAVGTGLMTRTLERITSVDPGFRADNGLTFRLTLPSARYGQPERQRAFIRQVRERLAGMPGVKAAALATYVPMAGAWGFVRFTVDGRPAAPEDTPSASNQVVTPEYFSTMGIRLLAGRFFTAQDDENAPRAAVVNQALARRYWPGESPLGARLHLDGESPAAPPLVVVGVAGNVHQMNLYEEPLPELYRCYYQAPTGSMSAVIRASGDPLALAGAARREVAGLDPNQPLYNVKTLERIVADSAWQARLTAVLFGVFSGLALLLAAIGIYGLTDYTVAQRTREMGLRAAMGAPPASIVRLVLRHGCALAAAGVSGGLVAAWLFARALSGLLYGVSSADAITFLSAALLLFAVALAANLAPALRAARADPVTALRHE